eukprot:gene18047-19856_t
MAQNMNSRSVKKKESTFDDIFEDVVLIEQKLYKEGYQEGYYQGQLVGEKEGYALGIDRGKAFGQEVGFYDGLVETMRILYESKGKPRLNKLLNQMHQKIERIKAKPCDPQDQEIFDDLEDVMTIVDATPMYGQSSSEADSMSF